MILTFISRSNRDLVVMCCNKPTITTALKKELGQEEDTVTKYEVHMFPEEVIVKVKDILEVKTRKNLMEMNTKARFLTITKLGKYLPSHCPQYHLPWPRHC